MMKKYRFYLSVLCAGLMFLLSDVDVVAQEKKLQVTLSQEYKTATFYFEFEESKEYNVTVTSPNGVATNKTITGEQGEVSIDDVVQGDYEITISADGTVEMNARVECKKASVTDNTNNVTISSSLTDLMLFFVDGDLCITWKDTGVGKINVVVTNPENMQRIVNTTVSGTEYRTSIPENVKEIECYLVPASSAKVEGAGVKYTLNVIRELDGNVIFPEVSVINSDIYKVHVEVADNTTVVVDNNDSRIYEEHFAEAGIYEVELELTGTNNYVTAYIIDSKNNMNSYSTLVTKDMLAPQITFNDSYDGITTKNSVIEISGMMIDGDSLYINNLNVTCDEYGRFAFSQNLEEGANEIAVCAIDKAGNENLILVTIVRENGSGVVLYVIFLAIVILSITMIFLLRKKLRKENNSVKTEHATKPPKKDKVKAKKKAHKKSVQRKNKKSSIIEKKIMQAELISVSMCLLSVLIFFTCIVKNTVIVSGSMEPTLMTNDCALYNKLAYVFKEVERGDIISYWSEEHQDVFSKRVIGVAGDKIEFHDGYVFINGMMADESAYLAAGIETNCTKSFEVPDGTVFVMGDNRENSIDSRFFNEPYINTDAIYGKYIGSYPNIFAFFSIN